MTEGTDVGPRLKAAREKAGISQYRLAKISGVSQAFISEIESGEKQPTTPVLAKLCSALGMSLADFFADTVPLSDSAVIEKRNEKGEVAEVRVATEAAHRTDGYDDELPEEARKALEEYKEFLRQKYRKK